MQSSPNHMTAVTVMYNDEKYMVCTKGQIISKCLCGLSSKNERKHVALRFNYEKLDFDTF
jgi:hypothetical protein